MKKAFLLFFWALFWLTLQSTLLSNWPSQRVYCDILFLTAVAISFSKEFAQGLAPVFLLGIFSDGVSISFYGLHTISFLAVFCVLRFINALTYVQSVIGRFIWTFAASVFAIWLKAALFALITNKFDILAVTIFRFLQQSALNGILGLVMIPLYYWYENLSWDKIFRPKGYVISTREEK